MSLFNNNSLTSTPLNAKTGQPINNLNQSFLFNNVNLPANLPSKSLNSSNNVSPLLNTIRSIPNNLALCNTSCDGQQCTPNSNCTSCPSINLTTSQQTTNLLNQTYYTQPFNPSLIDLSLINSSPQSTSAAIASLLKNNYSSRFYRNSDFQFAPIDLTGSNANCDNQLRFKAVQSSK